MRSWRPVPRNRSRWLILCLLGWCSTPAVGAPHRHRHRHRHPAVRPAPPPPRPEASSARSCELWPPKSFPSIVDLYALKLEYDLGRLGQAVARPGGKPAALQKELDRALESHRERIVAGGQVSSQDVTQP